jgi:vancomycin resistance protein VanW
MNVKNYIPASLRLHAKILLSKYNNFISGDSRLFAQTKQQNGSYAHANALTQPIHQNEYAENKIHNLSRGIDSLNDIMIYPNEIFSFWQIVGQPSLKTGYRMSRNIISGVIKEDYGGGLCQLSGILYHLAMVSGMKIKERYNHSVDLYHNKEAERFAPLGSDATVVYGYKDLKFQNPYPFPIQINLSILNYQLECVFRSAQPLLKKEIFFEKADLGDKIEVSMLLKADSTPILLQKSVYKKKCTCLLRNSKKHHIFASLFKTKAKSASLAQLVRAPDC